MKKKIYFSGMSELPLRLQEFGCPYAGGDGQAPGVPGLLQSGVQWPPAGGQPDLLPVRCHGPEPVGLPGQAWCGPQLPHGVPC